nr:hypothetical protein [Candidatus Chloroploca sp. Khr17]
MSDIRLHKLAQVAPVSYHNNLFGFGPLAGVLTLSFATIGFLAKLLAEAIETRAQGAYVNGIPKPTSFAGWFW